jgi:hypothetical protein
MSRYAVGNTQAVVAANMLNSIAAKEDNYRASILENHSLSKSIAQRLSKDSQGGLEDILITNTDATATTQTSTASSSSGMDGDKIQRFLQEQRETRALKGIGANEYRK